MTQITLSLNSAIVLKNENRLHCIDGPCVIDNHTLAWYVKGTRHRADGPALIVDFKSKKPIELFFNRGKEIYKK